MKKSYNPISDVSNEKNELTRRIYRTLTEVVRQLDDVRGRSQNISDLFQPCSASLRVKLHELCYKLILTDPLGYGKKGEELLWRKGYHDVFSTAKRLRKNDLWLPADVAQIQGLLISGIGHYEHLLFKLQTDYKLNLQGIIDFPLSMCDLGLPKGKLSSSQQKTPDKNITEWAKESSHRCLIYLGDLNRYLLDIYPLWDSGAAERYYMQAANFNIFCGRPHNQMGTLCSSKNYNLDAVYHYVRCITRPTPFEGAEGNLRKALERNIEFIQLEPFTPNPATSIQKVITKFLFLFDIWYFEKTVDQDLHYTCHEMLQELQFCLNEEKTESYPIDENEMELTKLTPFKDRCIIQPDRLDADMVMKMVILVLLCVDKLQKKDSTQTSTSIAMCLAIFSQILHQLITRFQQFNSRFAPVQLINSEYQTSVTSMSESPIKSVKNERYKKKNKFEKPKKNNNQTNGHSYKKNFKYSEKKDKSKNSEIVANGNSTHFSDGVVEDEENAEKEKQKKDGKKKCRLKRRKKVRQTDLCDSELSDSDITLNDSSSEDEYLSRDSASDEEVSSGGESLDETLLIIDQKIKEKKNQNEQKNNEKTEAEKTVKNNEMNFESKQLKDADCVKNSVDNKDLEKEVIKNGLVHQNGVKVNEEDKILFASSNGFKDDKGYAKNGDNHHVDCSEENASEINSTDDHLASETGDAEKEIITNNGLSNSINVDPKEMLQFLSNQDLLKVVKVYCDWLRTDPETIKACSKSSKTLFGKLVEFLNLINVNKDLFAKEYEKLRDKNETVPLSEDILTRDLNILRGGHEKLNWDHHKASHVRSKEESLLRLSRLIEFGHYLTNFGETGIQYNQQTHMFCSVGENGKVSDSFPEANNEKFINNATRKGQLMKNMGQLWLKAEVRDLESRVRRKGGNFSPYLVVDSEALIEHIALVKQLVGSRQFIVIIPAVVLSHLDECKRDSGRARETIRWLESQFQHGNRSLKAQKSQERFSLPLIKYPKKKDKEAWNFFQIVECCHYFSKQSEFQNCHSNLLVTLLTGQKDLNFLGDNKRDDFGKDYSPIGVAKNFGINLEHIETFHTKWKLSTKSHG